MASSIHEMVDEVLVVLILPCHIFDQALIDLADGPVIRDGVAAGGHVVS